MKTLSLQSEVVYGPIHSRRFGRSLGINLLPTDDRVCSFNCVYCQYKDGPGGLGFSRLNELKPALEAAFQRLQSNETEVDWIMFSGNGEPTLHPDFIELVDFVIDLRKKYLPKAPIGILSNSSTCHKKEIASALMKLEGRFMKLDAGSLYLFHDMNRPVSMLVWGEVVAGLTRLGGCTLQSMFVTGKVDNTTDRAVEDWVQAVKCINPQQVQIYTIDRTPQETGIMAASDEVLGYISKRLLKETGIRSVVFGHDAD